ncbi:MAG TPA: SH3 domain-containing protein, partial [Phototrophicaceae bacterium]|nr:SH3 domain-containing protein [Phototrophicaceae bacterium]
AEGDGYYTYWLEPTYSAPPPPACPLPNRLMAGSYGRVTPGLPNVVRSAPGTNSSGSSSVIVGNIPGGAVFSVLSGPQCGSDGRWWWYVNYNGLVGYTPEGEGSGTYWTEPYYSGGVACPGFVTSRLTKGSYGRVTTYPNLPNRLRDFPSYNGFVSGSVPAGGVFTVLDGPNCAQNTAWWLVSYNGVTGWTAEGSGSQYWLEPY